MGANSTRISAGAHAKYDAKPPVAVAAAVAVARDLVRHLRAAGLPKDDAHSVAFNLLLVNAGARTATLLESSDYYDLPPGVFENLVRYLTSQQTALTHVQFAHRNTDTAAPQFLVYNPAVVSPVFVDAALKDSSAMGKVLGFQCAGQLGENITVTFTVSAPRVNFSKDFYTEVCAMQPDTTILNAQLKRFARVANPLGWRVYYTVHQVQTTGNILSIIRAGKASAHLSEIADELLRKMLYVLQRAVVDGQITEWDMVAAAIVNSEIDFDACAVAYPLSHADAFKVETESERAQQLLLPDALNNLRKLPTPSIVSTWTDVQTLIVQERYNTLNAASARAAITSLLQSTCAPDALKFISGSPEAWRVFYVFIAFRILHNVAKTLDLPDALCMDALAATLDLVCK